MSIQLIRKNQQARGQFNGGEILENKPIGFPREGGHIRPYSNLFYWAHAWSDQGSTIPLHPHQGFEIMSFVLSGSIEHFDTKLNEWITLDEGSAQIIRAGNGISHSEKINRGAHMFQIWFDPNLDQSMIKEPSYNDYRLAEFPRIKQNGANTVIYKGEGSPLTMDAQIEAIEMVEIHSESHKLQLDKNLYHSFYVTKGELTIENDPLQTDDFFIVSEQEEVQLNNISDLILFKISSPLTLDYKTYSQRLQDSLK